MRQSPLALAALALCLAAGPALGQPTRPAADAGGVPEPIRVGQEAPDFTLPGPNGASFTLTELRGEKDLVLVFVRGSW